MVKSRDGIPPPPMPEGYRMTSVPSDAARLPALAATLLHERLEVFRNYMLGQTEEVWADENIDALLREVAAALRPPAPAAVPAADFGTRSLADRTRLFRQVLEDWAKSDERLSHAASAWWERLGIAVLDDLTAALRPPEGGVGEVIAELERMLEFTGPGTSITLFQDDLRAALAHLRRLPEEREAGRLEERERVARRLEEEADLMPCSEDATVYRSAAMLVRADFSYDGAEEYEDALAVAERRLAAVEAALREIEALADGHRDGWLETRYTGGDQQYRLAIDEGLKWEAVGALARALTKAEL